MKRQRKPKKQRRKRAKRKSRGAFESLEPRQLLAVTPSLSGNLATFAGDTADDTLELRTNESSQLEFSTDGGNTFVTDLEPNTSGTQALTIDASTGITVNLGGGADRLTLADSLTLLLNTHSRSVTFDGGDGADTLVGPNDTATWSISGPGAGVLATGSTAQDVVQFSSTESVVGSGSNDNLAGMNQAAVWNVTGEGAGSYNIGTTKQIDFASFF